MIKTKNHWQARVSQFAHFIIMIIFMGIALCLYEIRLADIDKDYQEVQGRMTTMEFYLGTIEGNMEDKGL